MARQTTPEPAEEPADGDAPEVVLRHRDASSQARMYGAFAAALAAIPALAIPMQWPGRWWMLALLIPAGIAGAAAWRLATLRAVLDSRGIHEPTPTSRGIFTPWSDVKRVSRVTEPGAAGLRFMTIQVAHRDGFKHRIGALNMSTRDPAAQKTVDGWVETIQYMRAKHSG